MFQTVAELEATFPGRHFTLDGHLIGSIGEVLAAYYYGIELYEASEPIHDGEDKNGRRVQIKITQQDNIVISGKPDYLVVLYLTKAGDVYEVYNGPGAAPWDMYPKKDSHNNRHMLVNKLMELDTTVLSPDRSKISQNTKQFGRKQWKMGENRAIMTSHQGIAPKNIVNLGENRNIGRKKPYETVRL